jgi:N-acetylglucosaminyldiphosphoundecaprenol N-acetyl-beta-D-mannosaminyltransferase
MKRVHIQGVPIDIATADEAVDRVLDRVAKGERTRVAGVNASVAVMAGVDVSLLKALQECDLVLADGKWVAMAATCLSRRWVPHTNTSPFLRLLLRRWGGGGLRIFLLGGNLEIVRRAAAKLPRLFSNIVVVGYAHGYYAREEEDAIVDRINASGADVVLVGMPTPKKEMLIRNHWPRMTAAVTLGIGGLIDIWGGKTQESPEWVRNSGFEWLFRLVQEPRRLWKRYTVDNLTFLWMIVMQACGLRLRYRPSRNLL